MDIHSLPRDRQGYYILNGPRRKVRISPYKELVTMVKDGGLTYSQPYLDGVFYLEKILMNIYPRWDGANWLTAPATPLRMWFNEDAEKSLAINMYIAGAPEAPCLDPENHVKNVVIPVGRVIEAPIYDYPSGVPFQVFTAPDVGITTTVKVFIHRGEYV